MIRLVRLCLFLVLVVAPEVLAESIPLTSGETIERDVLGIRKVGLLVRDRTGRGEELLPWTEIEVTFPMHPSHGRAARPPTPTPPPVAPPRPAVGAAAPRPSGETRGARGRRPEPVLSDEELARPHGGRFTLILLAVSVVFWLNILSVWLVSREDLVGGGTQQNWNLGALLFGLPVALIFLAREKGIRHMFGQGVGPGPSKGATAICTLFTWDGKPVMPVGGRRRSTGLITAQSLLARGAEMNASDVHFDTTTYGVEVKYRVDGVLREPEVLTADVGKKTMAAVKMAAAMDSARQQDAQDGACHMAVNDVWFDLRIARAWAVNGETLVVRLLRSTGVGGALTDLGMEPESAREMLHLIEETAGIIILAGPTGSGKTSTIYALLRKVVGTGRNILTIEDPVEYRLEGATQISLNIRAGATFAKALKASMRHDPDVILVGEIRDAETMEVAFQAGLTGHLVFTTIHATSVLATIGRLHEMGLSSYMINTGLKCIVCQRLVRLLCPTCRVAYTPAEDEIRYWGLTAEECAGKLFYKPTGCRLCEDSGYHGRRAVYRTLFLNNDIRKIIRPDVPTGDLQQIVDKYALGDPTAYARTLLWPGVTSPLELQRTLDMFDFGKALGARQSAPPVSG